MVTTGSPTGKSPQAFLPQLHHNLRESLGGIGLESLRLAVLPDQGTELAGEGLCGWC